jgi:hypothetical protein
MSVMGTDFKDIHIWINRQKLMFECGFLDMRVKEI